MSKVTIIDIGDSVICDSCGEDYTTSEAQGGILFAGKAICPSCQPRWEEGAKKYKEEFAITARANEGETYRAFVLRIRDGNNLITIEEL